VVLEQATVVAIRAVLPTGLNFLEQVRALLVWIMEAAMHGVCHGAVTALAITTFSSNLRWTCARWSQDFHRSYLRTLTWGS
jgi:hypothetical protein